MVRDDISANKFTHQQVGTQNKLLGMVELTSGVIALHTNKLEPKWSGIIGVDISGNNSSPTS